MKKFLIVLISAMMFLTSCAKEKAPEEYPEIINDNYRNYYEIYVGAFSDSDGDGIGDIRGIIEKLDYLNDGDVKTTDDLGITGIWLMPIMPSDTYHKYDVKDYKAIDEDFGTMEDFEELVNLCNERGIDIILDLVLNHTSYDHPWFVSARSSLRNDPCGQETCTEENLCPEHNKYVNYYHFSKEKETAQWYQSLGSDWYYEAVFWDKMPDLNLDNEDVRAEILDIGKFWLDKGVKGFRLDATTHFYRENVTENTEFLKWLTDEFKKISPDVYMVGEAWTGNTIINNMYESGLPSFFNFPMSNADGSIIKSVKTGKDNDIAQNIEDWQKSIREANPNAIDAVFLTNHDNARSFGALSRKYEQAKMAASVYMLMPGNSFIYYGEEIGMTGSGVDENKRQPMVWSTEKDDYIAAPVTGSTHFDRPEKGVDEQLKDENSLVNFYKKIIRTKDLNPEIARGTVTAIEMGNESVCAYVSEYEGSKVYIIHNLAKEGIDITLDNDIFKDVDIRAELCANGGEITIKDNKLVMPALSTVILK